MESAYSVTRLSIAYMVAAHARTPIHTNTPQSMIAHQGFRVESWALTYRCYICRSLGLLVVERPQCASLRPHVYNGVQIQTLLLPAVASLDKEQAYTVSPSHQGEAESSYQFQTYVSMGRQSCLTTGFVNTCNSYNYND